MIGFDCVVLRRPKKVAISLEFDYEQGYAFCDVFYLGQIKFFVCANETTSRRETGWCEVDGDELGSSRLKVIL